MVSATTTGVMPSGGAPRLMALDLLRILAAAWVAAFHWTVNSGIGDVVPPWLIEVSASGYLGVDVFFILSGAVIVHSAMRRSWSDFARGRFLRLFPVFLASALLVLVPMIVLGREVTIETLLRLTGLNFWLDVGLLVGPSWTLAYEVVFYVLAALAILVSRNKLTGRRIRIALAVYLLAYLLALYSGSDLLAFMRLGDFAPLFMLGAILGISRSGHELRANGPLIFVALALSANSERLRTAKEGMGGAEQILWVVGLLAVTCAFVLWSSLRPVREPRHRVLGRAVQTLSLMTYPIYLVHHEFGTRLILELRAREVPSIAALSLVLALVLALSWLSVRFYEPWARRSLRRLFAWDVTPPADRDPSREDRRIGPVS